MLPEMLTFLTIIPSQILCLLPMRNQLKFGFARSFLILALLDALLLPAAAFLTFRLSVSYIRILIPLLAVFYGAYQYCLRCPVCKSLSVYLSVCALTETLSNAACAAEAGIHPEYGAFTVSTGFALLKLIMYACAAGLLSWPFLRYATELVDCLNISRIWYMTLPFSAAFIGMSVFLMPLKFETLFVNNVFRAFLFALIFTLILWILLHVMFYFVVSGILTAADQKEKMQLLEIQESQFAAQKRYMEESARARHDFRQSVRIMKELFHHQQYEALGRFIDGFYENLPHLDTIRYCENEALNALLNYYRNTAEQEKIRTVFKINLPDRLPISDVDICSIVGNILENGILACGDVPEDRQIHLTIQMENGGRLFLVATNSHGGRIRCRNGRYLSTRQHGEGLGLRSVQSIAARYGGTAEFHHDDREFVSNVMLPLR